MHQNSDKGITLMSYSDILQSPYQLLQVLPGKRLQPRRMYSVGLVVGLFSLVSWGPIWEVPKFHLDTCQQAWWMNSLLGRKERQYGADVVHEGRKSPLLLSFQCSSRTGYLANDFHLHLTTSAIVFIHGTSKRIPAFLGSVLFLAYYSANTLLTLAHNLPVAAPSDASGKLLLGKTEAINEQMNDYTQSFDQEASCPSGPVIGREGMTSENASRLYFSEYNAKPYC
ncbi:Gamma-Glutamylaminecyclotransferase [Manis pentadactyla]|nr:Gamma-Glutamylaminecyclotransferase [Manis pentadactyla]